MATGGETGPSHLVVLTAQPRPEDLAVLGTLAEHLGQSSPLWVLLLNDAVYLAGDRAGQTWSSRIHWVTLEEDARGRGVTVDPPDSAATYAEVVRLVFSAGKVIQLP